MFKDFLRWRVHNEELQEKVSTTFNLTSRSTHRVVDERNVKRSRFSCCFLLFWDDLTQPEDSGYSQAQACDGRVRSKIRPVLPRVCHSMGMYGSNTYNPSEWNPTFSFAPS